MPSVLIVTPTYIDLLRPETAAAVEALRFDGQMEWKVLRYNPFPAPDARNVLAQYQHARQIFLEGDYDALLTVEHDMVPPPHALQALWDAGKPVAYGVYLLRHGSLVLNAYEYIGDRNMGESLSIRSKARRDAGLVRVSGVGFGCTLIRREVLERFDFHDGGDLGQSPDVPFAYDCIHAGVEQWAHFGVLCGHWEGGKVLMPFDDDVGAERKAVASQTMNVLVNGASVHIVAGREYTFPAGTVMELMRAGYMRPPTPAVLAKDEANDAVPGSFDPDVRQAPEDAGAEHGEPGPADRPGLAADAVGGRGGPGRRSGKSKPKQG